MSLYKCPSVINPSSHELIGGSSIFIKWLMMESSQMVYLLSEFVHTLTTRVQTFLNRFGLYEQAINKRCKKLCGYTTEELWSKFSFVQIVKGTINTIITPLAQPECFLFGGLPCASTWVWPAYNFGNYRYIKNIIENWVHHCMVI